MLEQTILWMLSSTIIPEEEDAESQIQDGAAAHRCHRHSAPSFLPQDCWMSLSLACDHASFIEWKTGIKMFPSIRVLTISWSIIDHSSTFFLWRGFTLLIQLLQQYAETCSLNWHEQWTGATWWQSSIIPHALPIIPCHINVTTGLHLPCSFTRLPQIALWEWTSPLGKIGQCMRIHPDLS